MKSVFKVKAITVLTAMLFVCVLMFTACPNTANGFDQALGGVVPSDSPKPPIPPEQDNPPSTDLISISVLGDENVRVITNSFTVPKGSRWTTVLAKAVACVEYTNGWESGCWKLGNKNGNLIDKYYSQTFDTATTVYAQAQRAAAKVEGGVSFLLDPSQAQLKIKAVTIDNSPITVIGCEQTSMPSGFNNALTLRLKTKGAPVVLKGKIVELYCDMNQITSLNVQGLTSLKVLGCGLNQLTTLNVQGVNSLQKLYCHANQLTSLDVHGLSALQSLNCATNILFSLNTTACFALQELYCDYNRLNELKVQDLSALRRLSAYANRLTSLDVHDLSALQELFCAGNRLTSLNIKGATSLKKWNCYCNRLDKQAFEKIFSDLPTYSANSDAQCELYSSHADYPDGNFSDFTSASDVATAFKNAKLHKHWKMLTYNADGRYTEI